MLQGEAVDAVARADKRDDLDRKLRLASSVYDIIKNFRQCCMLDKRKMDDALRYLGDTSPIDFDKPLPEGPKLF